jgi:prolyl oligopeptidase
VLHLQPVLIPEGLDSRTGSTLYSVSVGPDPFRWLEDDNSPETTRWVEEENKVTFAYLEQIPFRLKVKERIKHLLKGRLGERIRRVMAMP